MIRRALGLGLVLALPTHAGDIVHTGGTLGQPLVYDLTGNGGIIYAFLPSLGQGPTPLGLIDPADPRLLNVGLDLQPLWTVSAFSGSGTAQIVLPLPASAGLQGLTLHSQFVEIPLFPMFFGDISSPDAVVLGLPGTTAVGHGQTIENRTGNSFTPLDDGTVLAAGGAGYPPGGASLIVDTLEIIDPQLDGALPLSAVLSSPRLFHGDTKLDDGRVLFSGGADFNATATGLCDIYDPVTQTVSAAGALGEARAFPVPIKLNDGRVFVSGGLGVYDPADLPATMASGRSTTEIYDPQTDTWSPGPNLPKARALHNASLLPDGRVLITGGIEVTVVFGLPIPSVSSDSQIYDPVSNTLSAGPSYTSGSALHAQLTLPNGKVLIAGGLNIDLAQLNFTPLDQTHLYDPNTNTWTQTADLDDPRGLLGMFDTGTGVVAIGGVKGVDVSTNSFTPALGIETTDYNALSWTRHSDMQVGRETSTSALVDNNTRALTIGAGTPQGTGPANVVEIFFVP